MARLKSRIVVVTGASAGIGRAIATAFARKHSKVALIARGLAGLEGARRDVEAAGGEALIIPTDVAEPDAVFAAAHRVEEEWGPIDVWVNAAMATVFSPFADLSAEEYKRATEVTYLGSVYGTMAALERMRPRNRGTIVQVGSALGYRAIPLQAPYCGAKFAIRGYLQSLRAELIHDKSRVHVCEVQLAAFNTPQFDWGRNHMPQRPQPMPPIFQPEVAAKAVVWAATHKRREIWVGAPSAQMILASRWVPDWIMDAVMARKGYGGQLTDEPEIPGRPDNLFTPVDGDFGTHGRFDGRAKADSLQTVLSLHRGLTLVAASLAIGVATGLALGRKSGGAWDQGSRPYR